jgi:hypothetical protein
MDTERFDFLTRLLSSRRAILGSGFGALVACLGGGPAVEAKPKACSKSQKRCGKACIPRRSCCLRTHKKCGPRCVPKSTCCPGTKKCGAGCIPLSACCPACGPGHLCANGVCVIGQGTCPPAADVCGHGIVGTCNTASTDCQCYRTTALQTRCARGQILPPGSNACITDADCVARHPTIPGVFCTLGEERGGGGGGGCGAINFCQAPCPG